MQRNGRFQNMVRVIDTLRFVGHIGRHRRHIGAVAPSSPLLAKAMVQALQPLEPGQVVIELGPGTGVFTREIRRSLPGHPVMAVEFLDDIALRLQERLPEVSVIQGCASRLVEHLEQAGIARDQVGGIISGLPLLSLPAELRDRIFSAISEVLVPGRRYVQFTYWKSAWRHFELPGLRLQPTRRIFLNLPPAVVLPFVRE